MAQAQPLMEHQSASWLPCGGLMAAMHLLRGKEWCAVPFFHLPPPSTAFFSESTQFSLILLTFFWFLIR